MPKGIPNKNIEKEIVSRETDTESERMAKENDEDIIGTISKMLAESESKMLGVISNLSERIENVAKQNAVQKPIEAIGLASGKVIHVETGRCPQDIRDAVDKLISPKCIVRVEDSRTSPSFTVHVTLPEELQSEKNDTRSKTVSYSQGIVAINEWLEKVRANIWNEFKSRGQSVPR